MIRHGATPQQVRKFLVAFWKAVLRMSCAAHPPQLRNEGDWARPGYTLVAFDYLYPARDFPAAGHWHLRPLESSSVPPALHLHLWHHISGVSIYVPERRMAHHGTGDVLTMEAHVAFLPPNWWTCSAFALHRSTTTYVVGLTTICTAFCALAADARFAFAYMLEVPRPA